MFLVHYEAIVGTVYFSRTEFTCPLLHTREYVLVNSLQLKLSVAAKCASKHLWGTIYFDVDLSDVSAVKIIS